MRSPTYPGPDLSRRTALVALLALTLLGGALRSWRLSSPAIWGDEASTYRRVSGSYDDLLQNLVSDGFTPLHYELYWWISRGMPVWPKAVTPPVGDAQSEAPPTHYRAALRLVDLFGAAPDAVPTDGTSDYDAPAPPDVVMTPAVMRIVPAVAGTLMVPAVYFLGVQLTRRRRVSLLAAFMAAVSAYLLVYSRDAKMYMHLWLFATLHVGCLLAWLHTLGDPTRTAGARRVWWWAWVAAGVACVGTHAPGLMILAVDVVILATAGGRLDPLLGRVERRGRYLPEALLRAIDAALLTVRWAVGVADRLTHLRTRSLGDAAQRATERAYSVPGERSRLGRVLQRRGEAFRWPAVLPFALGLLVVAAGPAGYYGYFNRYGEKLYGEADRPADDVRWGASGLEWVEFYNAGRTGGDLVLYTTSAYLTGWEWVQPQFQPEVPEACRKALKAVSSTLVALLVVGLIPWRRAASRLRRGVGGEPTSADDAPRWRPVLWVAAWVVLPAYGVYCASSGTFASPLDWPIALVLSDVPELQRTPAVVARPDETATGSAGAVASLASLIGPLDPAWRAASAEAWGKNLDAIRAAFTAQNVRWGLLSILATVGVVGFVLCAPTWAGRLRVAGAYLGVALFVWLACVAVYAGFVAKGRVTGGSVWMPRYMGIMIPAVLVGAAVLFSRLPTRPVRWLAVGLFAAANLGQFAGRVWGDSEPPTGRIAADLIAAGDRDLDRDSGPRRRPRSSDARPGATQQTYLRFGFRPTGSPGTGLWGMPAMNYYLLVETATDGVPRDVLGGRDSSDRFAPPANDSRPNDFVRTVAERAKKPGSPGRVVVWSTATPGSAEPLDDPILAALGPDWTRREDLAENYVGREHWTWRDLYALRRRVYDRAPAPAPPPVARAK